MALNDTTDQMYLLGIERAFHPKADHMTGYKTSLGKFKKTEILSSIFSGHNIMRLRISHNNKKKLQKTNMWKLNNMLLNNQWVPKEIKRKSKNT